MRLRIGRVQVLGIAAILAVFFVVQYASRDDGFAAHDNEAQVHVAH
jgi:hypothetical protein